VALAEEGWHHGAIATAVAEEYLAAVRGMPAAKRPDVAILGCTHFPLLSRSIQAALGPEIAIVDSATTTAVAVAAELKSAGLVAVGNDGQELIQLVATDGAARFARVGSAFLGRDFSVADIELTDIHPSDLGA
jgi:glutamate racemase